MKPAYLDQRTEPSANGKNYRDELHLSRRIDWRFLLPNPDLGCVGYVGSPDEELQRALNYFSHRFEVLTEVDLGKQSAGSVENRFDLMVISSGIDSVKRAMPFIKIGGYLYWELRHHRHGRRFFSALRCREMLIGLGFSDMHIQWHRPDFSNCKEIIPLDCRSALEYVFCRESGSMGRRVKFALGRLMARAGVLPFVAPCLSLVGYRGQKGERL